MEYLWRKHSIDITALGSSLAGADALYFRVYIDDYQEEPFQGDEALIYSGRAVAAPGASGIYVAVNDIVADYMARDLDLSQLPDVAAFIPDARLFVWVRIDASLDGQEWFAGSAFALLNDWSWLAVAPLPKWKGPVGGCLNNLIRPESALNSWLLCTVIGGWDNLGDIDLYIDGDDSLGIATGGSWNNGTGAVYLSADAGVEAGQAIDVRAGEQSGIALVPCKVTDGCVRYMLYYRNAYGGWDWLLVHGPRTRSESYERQTAGRSLPATPAAKDRQKVNYRNDVTERWRLPLGQFTEAQAAQLWHLTGSPSVYLFDIERQSFTPVTVTDATYTEQTYRNNGHKMIDYTVEVESALDKQRR